MTGFRFAQRNFMDSFNYQRIMRKTPSGRWVLGNFKKTTQFGKMK